MTAGFPRGKPAVWRSGAVCPGTVEMDGSGWRPGGGLVGSPGAVGTAGTWPSRAGPHFSGEMGERAPGAVPLDPVGERVSFPHTPFLWTVVEAAWVFCRPTWPAASKTTPHGPPTSSGGREKWFVDGRRKRETKRFLSAFSQRVPTHVPSPPSRWAGRYGPFNVRAAGQVTSEKYNFPPHNPTREGSPEGRTSSLSGVLSPISSQEMGPRPGRPPFPPVPTAWGSPPKERCPARPHANRGRPALKKPAASGTTPPRHAPRRTPPR